MSLPYICIHRTVFKSLNFITSAAEQESKYLLAIKLWHLVQCAYSQTICISSHHMHLLRSYASSYIICNDAYSHIICIFSHQMHLLTSYASSHIICVFSHHIYASPHIIFISSHHTYASPHIIHMHLLTSYASYHIMCISSHHIKCASPHIMWNVHLLTSYEMCISSHHMKCASPHIIRNVLRNFLCIISQDTSIILNKYLKLFPSWFLLFKSSIVYRTTCPVVNGIL